MNLLANVRRGIVDTGTQKVRLHELYYAEGVSNKVLCAKGAEGPTYIPSNDHSRLLMQASQVRSSHVQETSSIIFAPLTWLAFLDFLYQDSISIAFSD